MSSSTWRSWWLSRDVEYQAVREIPSAVGTIGTVMRQRRSLVCGKGTVEMDGFEPTTPWLQTRCSARLSYIPVASSIISPCRC